MRCLSNSAQPPCRIESRTDAFLLQLCRTIQDQLAMDRRGLSTLALLITVVWTVVVLADIQAPATGPPSPSKLPAGNGGGRCIISPTIRRSIFDTANEIHIPAGQPVRF
jgi:hypothetical protein